MNKEKAVLMVIGVMLVLTIQLFAAQSIIDSIAVVSDHSGAALVFSDGKWKSAEINMPIYEGDAFRTKADSSLEITFDDATIIKLGPNTDLKLSQLKRNHNIAVTVFSLVKGKFLAVVDKLKNRDSRFEVHTKMAIAAVKGTEFAITADDSEANIGVFEGSVKFIGTKGNVLVSANNESKIRGNLHREKNRVGIPDNPKKLIKMASFKIEIEKIRKEIKVIRELKQKGDQEVIQYRIKKKLQKEEKVIGQSDTQITIGGTNKNTRKIKEKVQNILKAKLKKELYNEKSHAYRDLKFVNEEKKADLHLGKTMTDVHGNRIRIEEFIYRPAADQVNLLSLTLREGRLDYLKSENIFVHPIAKDISLYEWKRMWQKQWYNEPTNWLKEQRIILSNVSDWVFMGVLYSPTLYQDSSGPTTRWNLLKHTEILAFTKEGAPAEPEGDMTVTNFIINPSNQEYVREHRIYGAYSQDLGTQPVYKGILDKTFNNKDELLQTVNYWDGLNPIAIPENEFEQMKNIYIDIAPSMRDMLLVMNGDILKYKEQNENLFNLSKFAMRHMRYYNDGSILSLSIVLIDDYGIMKDLPNPDTNAVNKAIWLSDVVLNSHVELIVHSNQFFHKKMGIDIVSKMLWWVMLNPQNADNITPILEEYDNPGNYEDPATTP